MNIEKWKECLVVNKNEIMKSIYIYKYDAGENRHYEWGSPD